MKKPPRRRNPTARALRAGSFKPRVVRKRKGRGSYRRKPKPPEADDDASGRFLRAHR
ncbi:MAG: ribosome alternative rescue factor ArfA [Proteobacteria bacterium]|nr:ribosome alternative rescue factor ArfA [Pseudomonadota bacterium]